MTRSLSLSLALAFTAASVVAGCSAATQDTEFGETDQDETDEAKANPGGKSDLVGMEESSRTLVDGFQLGFASELGIPHKTYKVIVNKELEDTRNYVVDVVFDALTYEQYDALMKHYGGEGLVAWDESRAGSYHLVDFLPPKIQALANHWMVITTDTYSNIPAQWQDPRNEPQTDVRVATGTNCWSTAYDVLYDWNKPFAQKTGSMFYVGPAEMESTLTDPSHFGYNRKLTRNEIFGNESAARNREVQVGDALYITTQYSTIGPAHVALWIDNDLWFEKTNFMSDDPIRLAFWDDVVKPYLEQDSEDTPVGMTIYRYSDGASPLPSPQTFAGQHAYGEADPESLPEELRKRLVFTLDLGLGGGLTEYSVTGLRSFPLVQDPASGRAVYEGADELSRNLKTQNVCRAEGSAYHYVVDRNQMLYVLDRESGQERSKLQGQYAIKTVELDVGGEQQHATSYMEFNSGDTVLRIYKDQYGTYALFHPGVEDSIMIECVQDPPYLGSTFGL
jgi:hypothetical protein